MHLPDGFLSAPTCAVTWTFAAVGIGWAWRATRTAAADDPTGGLPGRCAATAGLVFALQMGNVPLGPGVSGHALGAGLAVALLGTAPAILVLATVLAVQAVLFGDGGLAAYGANFLNMGLLACLGTAGVLRYSRAGRLPDWAGASVGAAVGVLAAALGCATALALSGTADGRELFPNLFAAHTAIALTEGLLTGVLVAATAWAISRGLRPAWATAALALPFVILAPWASELPDGLEFVANRLGFAAVAGDSAWAWFADYRLPGGSGGVLETLALACGGALLAALAAGLVPARSTRSSAG